MAWCRAGDKPLSEPMMVSLLTHICVTWPQWVKCATGLNDFIQQKVILPHYICIDYWVNMRRRHNSRQFADDIFKCILYMKNLVFRIALNYVLEGPTISQLWFGKLFGAEQARSHYLKQGWHNLLTFPFMRHSASTGLWMFWKIDLMCVVMCHWQKFRNGCVRYQFMWLLISKYIC